MLRGRHNWRVKVINKKGDPSWEEAAAVRVPTGGLL